MYPLSGPIEPTPKPLEKKPANQEIWFKLPETASQPSSRNPDLLKELAGCLMPVRGMKNQELVILACSKMMAEVLSKGKMVSKEDVNNAIQNFADAVVDGLKENYRNPHEPFHIYEMKLRGEIQKHADEFQERFTEGFMIFSRERMR